MNLFRTLRRRKLFSVPNMRVSVYKIEASIWKSVRFAENQNESGFLIFLE